MKKFLTTTMIIISALAVALAFAAGLWVIVSIIDIILHNLTTCEYMKYNIFSLLC